MARGKKTSMHAAHVTGPASARRSQTSAPEQMAKRKCFALVSLCNNQSKESSTKNARVCVCTCACSFIGPGWLPRPKSKTRRVICSSVSLSELKSLSVSLSFNSEYLGVPRPCKQSVLTQCQQIDFSIECFKTLLNQTGVQCQACTSGPL